MTRSLPQLTFVVAVNNPDILRTNLLASACFQGTHCHQVILQKGFRSASSAYNGAIERADNDIVVFVHQDVLLPEPWLGQVNSAFTALTNDDPHWGVLGCWGVKDTGEGCGHVYSHGDGVIGRAFDTPVPVQTLDEVVLIIRKSSGLRFDVHLPDFHFYGTDICMRAASMRLRCYAISAFCIHNTAQYFLYPWKFYQCYWYVRKAWSQYLPIHTSCIRISRFNADLIYRQLRRAYWGATSGTLPRGSREEDLTRLLKACGCDDRTALVRARHVS